MSKLTLSIEKLSDAHKNEFNQLKQKSRLSERLDIIESLEKHFPKCFNLKKPIPLKLGIEADVMKNLPEGFHVSRKKLQRAIKYYVSNITYRTILVKEAFRYDLEGNTIGTIDLNHKAEASRWLAEIRAMRKETLAAR